MRKIGQTKNTLTKIFSKEAPLGIIPNMGIKNKPWTGVCVNPIHTFFFFLKFDDVNFALCFFSYGIIGWPLKNLVSRSTFDHKQNLALIKTGLSQDTISKKCASEMGILLLILL